MTGLGSARHWRPAPGLLLNIRSLAAKIPPRTVRGWILFLLLVVLVPGLLAQSAVALQREAELRAAATHTNSEVARQIAATIENDVQDLLLFEAGVGYGLTATPTDPEHAAAVLTDAVREDATLRELDLFDPSGARIASSAPAAANVDVGPYLYALIQGGDRVVSDLLPSDAYGEPVFLVGRSIRERGVLRGMMIATVSAAGFGDAVTTQRIGPDSSVIFDAHGHLVYRYPEEPAAPAERDAAAAPEISRALAGEAVMGAFATSPGGQPRLVSYEPVPSLGWVVGAAVAEGYVRGPIRDDVLRGFALLSIVMVVAFLVAVLVARGVTEPLHRLRHYARAVGEGDLSVRPDPGGPVEVTALAEAFSTMASEIKVREDELAATNAERGRLLSEIRRRAAELEATVASIPDGLLVCGPQGEVLRMNAVAERYLAHAGEAQRAPMRTRIAELGLETAGGKPLSADDTPVVRALEAGETAHGVVARLIGPDGQARWVSMAAAPIRQDDGAVGGAVATFSDVTDLQRLHQQREEYVRMISHDIGSPLTTIIAEAELLERRMNAQGLEHEVERLGSIRASAWAITGMIGDLVESFRFESGQIQLQRGPTDLRRLLVDLVARVGTPAQRRWIDASQLDAVPPVAADREKIERVLTNVITNAFKYSESGTTIFVALRHQDGEVRIAVRNAGAGIEADELPHVFDRYYRARNGQHSQGFGLGLYIARLIVVAHGGRIWAESVPGVSTTFEVALPVAGTTAA